MARIYAASSWRNEHQPWIVPFLRNAGHEVYDFRNPFNGKPGFSWRELDPDWQNWTGGDRIWIVAYTPEVFGEKQFGSEPRRILSRDGFLALVEDQGRGNTISSWWATEPSVARVVHGVSDRVGRLGALSNAVVPQIPEIIRRAIMRAS